MKKKGKFIRLWVGGLASLSLFLMNVSDVKANQVSLSGAPNHIGTFNGNTTFVTSSSNGINPGLYLEVMDRYGKITTYESEEGVITIPETQEGAYVTQAKILGKTKYKDKQTGKILDQWEVGRELELVSVENPTVTMSGKNLFDGKWEQGAISQTNGELIESHNYRSVNKIPVHHVNQIVSNGTLNFLFYDENDIFISYIYRIAGEPLAIPTNASYMRIYRSSVIGDLQIEEGATMTSYTPYQSNVLTTNENVELRQAGELRDDFDLLTGEITQRIGEVVLDGTEEWSLSDGDYVGGMKYLMNSNTDVKKNTTTLKVTTVSDVIPSIAFTDVWNERLEGLSTSNSDRLGFRMSTNQFETHGDFKNFLKDHPLTVQYHSVQETVKTIHLNSTYTFGRVTMRDVYVDGDVKSLICSVNVPTESLTFVLDPNQEEGQQFIAPTFNLINETPTSIRVTLSAFTQETNVFNDVLPTQHSDWSQLNREQSKDIALALVPVVSDGWLTVDETPRYVANDSSVVLGEIKAKSTVSLTFEALHGQAFIENLSPRYRLVFVFDF